MPRIRRFDRPLGVGLIMITLCAPLGCGPGDGLEKRLPVSGTVTYNGEPVPQGRITFEPMDSSGRPASGMIRDGRYSMTTLTPGDGVIPGQYQVGIVSRGEADISEVEQAAQGGVMDQFDLAIAQAEAEDLVPPKYNLASTSGLTAEVQRGQTRFNFDLTD